MKISKTSEMRFMDRYAVEKLDIPEEILMENAGQASTYVLAQEIGIKDKKFVVFCGIGNNGGDGLVVARKIHGDGGLVKPNAKTGENISKRYFKFVFPAIRLTIRPSMQTVPAPIKSDTNRAVVISRVRGCGGLLKPYGQAEEKKRNIGR